MKKEAGFGTTEKVPAEDGLLFDETRTDETTRFSCTLEGKEVGFISATLVGENTYNVSGLFVDSAERGRGISSHLVKLVNTFLERNKSRGLLVNTIKGNAATVYENNGWTRGDYKSQGAYGAYEYTYDVANLT